MATLPFMSTMPFTSTMPLGLSLSKPPRPFDKLRANGALPNVLSLSKDMLRANGI